MRLCNPNSNLTGTLQKLKDPLKDITNKAID
jgi:hypothetical protein